MNRHNYTERQIEIMEAATQIIGQKGIQEFTTKNLAKDIGLSEAALYRHFKSKNEIMLGMLDYFMFEMRERISQLAGKEGKTSSELLRDIFTSQLKTFATRPAIVSVIFSEGIFQFNKELMHKVSEMMGVMQAEIDTIIKRGQKEGYLRDFVGATTISTIIMGSMRMAVMKWKISGQQSDLVKDGTKVLNGVLKMIEKNEE